MPACGIFFSAVYYDERTKGFPKIMTGAKKPPLISPSWLKRAPYPTCHQRTQVADRVKNSEHFKYIYVDGAKKQKGPLSSLF